MKISSSKSHVFSEAGRSHPLFGPCMNKKRITSIALFIQAMQQECLEF